MKTWWMKALGVLGAFGLTLLGLLRLRQSFETPPVAPRTPLPPLPGERDASPAARVVERQAEAVQAKEGAAAIADVKASPDAIAAAEKVKRLLDKRRGGTGGGGVAGGAAVLFLALWPMLAHAESDSVVVPPAVEAEAKAACPLPADLPTGPMFTGECPETVVVTSGVGLDGVVVPCVGNLTPAWKGLRDDAAYAQAECLRGVLRAAIMDRGEWHGRAEALHIDLNSERSARDAAEARAQSAESSRVWWAGGGVVVGIVVVVAVVVSVAKSE